MSRALVVALALALAGGASEARGDDVAEARARFRSGAEHYRAARWREAIAEFEAAYRLKPHGAIHFNVAQCRERLGEWPAALRSYHDYLRELPDAKDRAAVRASMRRIEERLAAAGVQALLVYSDPPGAEVRLDGRVRGATPFQIVLPPATYAVALALEGYEPVSQDIAITTETSRVVDVVLRSAGLARGSVPSPPPSGTQVAAPSATTPPQRPGGPAPPGASRSPPADRFAPETPSADAAAPASPPGTGSAPADAPVARKTPGPSPDLAARPAPSAPLAPALSAPPREKRRVYTWIAAGTAVAAAAAGAYYGISAERDSDALHSMTAPDGEAASRYASDAAAKARRANVMYAVAGGAAAAGVTLFFVEKRF
jgi:hypothetical protein